MYKTILDLSFNSKLILAFSIALFSFQLSAQEVNEKEMGVWNMYFFNTTFGESRFGIQGDYQFRFWDAYTDLEQLLLRTGFTYKPKEANVLLTLGYGNITTGEPGDGNSTVNESRVYQEALLPHKVANRVLLNHRFRFEQRWVDSQDLRTRYRYNLFINIPFNMDALDKGVIYLALYNEIFIKSKNRLPSSLDILFILITEIILHN